MMSDTLTITMDRADLRQVVESGENNALYRAVLAAQAGEPLEDCLFTAWSQHWPVIDSDMKLTGEAVDSDDDGYVNYADEAMIDRDAAEAADWDIDGNYANPPDEDDDEAE